MTRRITPTAVRLLPADADNAEWLAARQADNRIGSSDVAAILGVADKRTALHVYRDKRGEVADNAGEAALWGKLLEDPVAREWARRNRSVIQRVGLIANVDHPWRTSTLDRRVAECPLDRSVRTACALEVKCRNAYTAPSRWRGDVPDDVLAQTVWQMAVTGYDHIHVAVLIGGNDYRQTVVRWDQAIADYITGDVTAWREAHLIAGVEPPWDLDKAGALIELDNLMHPDRSGTRELSVEDIGAVMEYAALSGRHGAAGRALKRSRAELGRLASGHQAVTFDGEMAFEFNPVTKPKVDLARLAEQWPLAYADCVGATHYYQIRIAPAYRLNGSNEDE
jgi:putative phage-type endonuclease